MNKEDKIGALWVNKEKSCMRGTINGAPVIIFKNGFKSEEKHPDYIVYKNIVYKREDKPKEEKVTSEGFMAVPTNEGELPF